jgi:hypothetical protein
MPKFLVCTHVYVHANGSGGPNRYLECIHKNTCVYIHTYPAYLACMPVYLHAWYLQCIHMYTCHCSVMYRHVNTCIICMINKHVFHLYTCPNYLACMPVYVHASCATLVAGATMASKSLYYVNQYVYTCIVSTMHVSVLGDVNYTCVHTQLIWRVCTCMHVIAPSRTGM